MTRLSVAPARSPISGPGFSPRFVLSGTFNALLWMVRQVFLAFFAASATFGSLFALLYLASALPIVVHLLVFHPGVIRDSFTVFLAIMAMYLFLASGRVAIKGMGRLYNRYPVLEKFMDGAFVLVVAASFVGGLYGIFTSKPVKTSLPPPPAAFWSKPQNRVLLHLAVPSKMGMVTPKGMVHGWTHDNIVGTAQVKNLGQGRYEIKMLQQTR